MKTTPVGEKLAAGEGEEIMISARLGRIVIHLKHVQCLATIFFSFSSFDIPSSPLHFPPPPNFPVGSLSIGINEPCLVTARPDDHILNVGRDISRYFYGHIWGEKLRNIHHFHQPAVKYMQRCQPMSWTCWGQSFCVCWLYTD